MKKKLPAPQKDAIRGQFFAHLVDRLKQDGRTQDKHIRDMLVDAGAPITLEVPRIAQFRKQGVTQAVLPAVLELFDLSKTSLEAKYLSGDEIWPENTILPEDSDESQNQIGVPNSKISLADAKVNSEIIAALLRALQIGRPDPSDGIPELPRQMRRPTRYAIPAYVSSFEFVGRQTEIQRLFDWALQDHTKPIFFVEAMGGTGKSMLAWHWMERLVSRYPARFDGAVWYSFYELGSNFDEFVSRILAYLSGVHHQFWRAMPPNERRECLLSELRSRQILLVLDGLERTLNGYHQDADRDGVETFNPEEKSNGTRHDMHFPDDTAFVQLLTTVHPTKVLITSRNFPNALTNSAGGRLPEIEYFHLSGLDPQGAEALMRQCGINGDSRLLQSTLSELCGNHPLVLGAVAKVVREFHENPCNFDAWVSSPNGLASLSLSSLSLTQRQNHILKFALSLLSEDAARLLSILSMLSWSASYDDVIRIFGGGRQDTATELLVSKRVSAAINELSQDGLLFFDKVEALFDLHPVVRSVAEGIVKDDDKKSIGNNVIDYFSRKRTPAYDDVTSISQIKNMLEIVGAQLQMGNVDAATFTYDLELSTTLAFNLEQHHEERKILTRLFGNDLDKATKKFEPGDHLRNWLACALAYTGDTEFAARIESSLVQEHFDDESWSKIILHMSNYAMNMYDLGYPDLAQEILVLAQKLSVEIGDAQSVFSVGLKLFGMQYRRGQSSAAGKTWKRIDAMGRDWELRVYRPGEAELSWLTWRQRAGKATKKNFIEVERVVESSSRNRRVRRKFLSLRGEHALSSGNLDVAIDFLQLASSMARSVSVSDKDTDILLAVARYELSPSEEALRALSILANDNDATHPALSEALWKAGRQSEALQAVNNSLRKYGDSGFGVVDSYLEARARSVEKSILGDNQ